MINPSQCHRIWGGLSWATCLFLFMVPVLAENTEDLTSPNPTPIAETHPAGSGSVDTKPDEPRQESIQVHGAVGTETDKTKGPQLIWHCLNPLNWHVICNYLANLVGAFIVGIFGAAAFYVGILTGFIDRSARLDNLKFLLDSFGNPRHLRTAMFIFFGGVIAAVFQWAQVDQFIPIQAFVLGATWPSVVSRVMAGQSPPGNGNSPPNSNISPKDVPSLEGGSSLDAIEIPINPQ